METQVASASPTSLHKQVAFRVESIDLLRGIVMVIMALDHTRDFFHQTAFTADPLDLQTTTPLLFFTRWITHFCAPVFVFLSGASIFFQSLRKSRQQLSSFLLKRGLWLIFVEIIVINFAFSFDVTYPVVFFQVIWAIGISMVLLAAATWLPLYLMLTIGLLIVFGHNLLDIFEAKHSGPYSLLYSLIHVPGVFPVLRGHSLGILYPFLPWTGIMMLGYCFGKFYRNNTGRHNSRVIALGLGVVALFVILRGLNLYGDPQHWSPHKSVLYSILSFLDTRKYPPSLLYSCMTLGPAIILLGLTTNTRNRAAEIFKVYGRVPFFYYVLHFYMIHCLAVILFLSRGHSWKEGMNVPDSPFKFVLPGDGYNLGIVYLIWMMIVIALYPLCKWFDNYKKTHKNRWLSYL